MKKQSYLDSVLLVIGTFLFALLLTGCAAPTQPPVPEEELAACRAVIQELQSHDSYHIHEYAVYDSDIVLNEDSNADLWRHGNDWLRLQWPVEDDLFAYLCKDGVTYESLGNSSENNIAWFETESVFDVPLWLYTCDWDALDIVYISTGYADREKTITLEVRTPVEQGGEVADTCELEFSFDGKGTIRSIVMDGLFHADYGDCGVRSTFTILSTDPEEIAAKIDGEYQKALAFQPNFE